MKKKYTPRWPLMTAVLCVGVIGGYLLTQMNTPKPTTATNQPPTKETCLADDCLAVDSIESYPVGTLSNEAKQALESALDDEYHALSFYEKVIAKFGTVKPFSMIKNSEEQHIAMLQAIYDKYGLTPKPNTWPQKLIAPDTLQQSCQTGVEAEIANAELYRTKLLPAVTMYEDITIVFTNLMNASQQKHLQAFERCN